MQREKESGYSLTIIFHVNRHTIDLTHTEICWMYIMPEISLQNLHNFMGQTCHTFISGLCLQFSSHSLGGLKCRSKSYTNTTFWQQKEYFFERKNYILSLFCWNKQKHRTQDSGCDLLLWVAVPTSPLSFDSTSFYNSQLA